MPFEQPAGARRQVELVGEGQGGEVQDGTVFPLESDTLIESSVRSSRFSKRR